MLQQYARAKEQHPGALVAMRVGDFYEFYGEDAEEAARLLEITLTGREDGGAGRVAMAGVPFHAVEKYLARLVKLGRRVALCEQVEDPKKAKGLVRREVVRVLSAGTALEDGMTPAAENAFVAGLAKQGKAWGLAMLDSSTGEFLAVEAEGEALLLAELARLRPAELIHSPEASEWAERAQAGLELPILERPVPLEPAMRLEKRLRAASLAGFGLEDKPAACAAAALALAYAEESGLSLDHISAISTYSLSEFMTLDSATRRSLEITRSMTDGSRRNTLLESADETRTAMGARLLRRWLEMPLLDRAALEQRHGAIARLIDHALVRGDLRDDLKRLGDIERLVGRASAGLASPRDLAALRDSLLRLPELEDHLRPASLERLQELREEIDLHQELAMSLRNALAETPPAHTREGGMLAKGFDLELDKLRSLAKDGRAYIAELEASERERTGIERLKVGFNSVFGYYLEVPKARLASVPETYIRKQTTANAERYITAELKEHESAVLGAEEKSIALEQELFDRLRRKVAAEAPGLLKTARALAELDALCGLAEAAVIHNWTRPEITDANVLEITDGRHPVVEAQGARFVPNSLRLDESRRLMILTGPNMSGKSTYLRQAALIVLLAQAGSFVPASSCRMGLCDRIFTRIGARDELALGQSTFMVEMVESANILNNATERSLVVLDEVGRGTSTFDGLAIAWAMVEHLARAGAKTLFATHYHQLNTIEAQISGVFNCRVSVEEVGDEVVWTHRVLPGGADRSYGVQVARMAGIPGVVLDRAREVLADLEGSAAPAAIGPSMKTVQMTLFEMEDPAVVQELRALDVEGLTPIQALVKLEELKRKA
jgi:DNA mismatch repair protein MutS